MKQFFKTVFASMIGAFLSILLLFFLGFLLLIGSIMSISKEEKVEVNEHSILHINLNETIQERGNNNPFNVSNVLNLNVEQNLGLDEILASLNKASEDPN